MRLSLAKMERDILKKAAMYFAKESLHAGHKDLFTGEIIGYAMAERMTKNLVIQSLLRALAAKRPAAGLIHHSDRGSQYCALEYGLLLDRCGMKGVHEPERKLLRQRPYGKLLGRAQE